MVAVLVLASCQAATTEDEKGATVTGKVTEEEAAKTEDKADEDKAEVVPDDTDKPIYGGTLVDAMGAGPRTFDPSQIFYSTGWYMNLVYERMLVADLDKGLRGTGEFPFAYWCLFPDAVATGALAESWEVEEDPLAMVFHIREGIYYQNVPPVNGREFVAQDVVDGFLYQVSHPGGGYGAEHGGLFGFIDSVVATDKYTVTFNLNAWDPDWMWSIGWGLFTIVPPEVVDAGVDDWNNAGGTGPFILTDYIDDVSATYEKNPNYWGKVRVPAFTGPEYQIPFVDRFQYVIIKDATMSMAAFRTGKIGFRWAVGTASSEEIEATCPGVSKLGYLNSNTNHVNLPVLVPPFDNLKVRKALSMALDREAYIAALGSGEILNYPAKDGDASYTPLEELPADVRENFEYNPERARELLAEAGYPNGFKTTILIQNSAWEDSMSLVAANWADIGVETTLDLQISPAFNDVMFSGNYTGGVGAGLGGCSIWCNLNTCIQYRIATEEEIADESLRKFKGNIIAGSGYNIGFVDPVAKEMLDRAKLSLDAVEAHAILKEVNLYYLSQVPAIIPATLEVNQYWWPWIKNFYGENGAGYFDRGLIYGSAWIDPDLKAEMGH